MLWPDAIALVVIAHRDHQQIAAASLSDTCHVVLTSLSLTSLQLRPVLQTQHTASGEVKLLKLPAKPIFYESNNQALRDLAGHAAARLNSDLALWPEHSTHGSGGLHFLFLMGVAVGALQEARVRVSHQLRHRLLVHAGVEQGGHIVMAERVQVIFLRKSNGLIDFPQRISDERTISRLRPFLVEPSTTPFPGTTLRERLMVRSRPPLLNLKSSHLRAHSSPRRQPVHTWRADRTSGSAAAPLPEHPAVSESPRGGNVLCSVACQRQIDHPGRVLLDDLIPLGVAKDSGDHSQVFLHRGLPDGFATVFPLPQFYQHILQSNRPEPV